MIKLLKKELTLSASILSFLFIVFGLMSFIPGYPILLGAFFTSFGIFQTFQSSREANDIVYSALLPVSKSDVVKSRFIFCIFIEMCSFAIMVISTIIRMTILTDVGPYVNNALMNANFVFLGFALVIFGLFNSIFVGGFFKTGYFFSKPFIIYIITTFLVVSVAETLHHIPGLGFLNTTGFDYILIQIACLITGIVIYLLLTFTSLSSAKKKFELIDL